MPKYKYVSNAALRLASFPSHVRKGDDDADFLTCFSVVVLLALDATNQHKHHKSVNKHHRRDYTPTNIPPASQHNETFNAKTNDCSSRSKTTGHDGPARQAQVPTSSRGVTDDLSGISISMLAGNNLDDDLLHSNHVRQSAQRGPFSSSSSMMEMATSARQEQTPLPTMMPPMTLRSLVMASAAVTAASPQNSSNGSDIMMHHHRRHQHEHYGSGQSPSSSAPAPAALSQHGSSDVTGSYAAVAADDTAEEASTSQNWDADAAMIASTQDHQRQRKLMSCIDVIDEVLDMVDEDDFLFFSPTSCDQH
eukprot:CAMPEP_0119546508 /NCGR_PEP_ID=MMETSP1352-20130426/903_1 /TAXON_ID=265584 /ORGANISM="Stauroneis constricta, Strain CCMP1120" /LENGTH=306 /DNA_ID=CAMNT_0007591219 /DNA_START=68 /DNA_END=989 /DNA_ORIENTATION=-